ncbi:MAG: UDP-N-acetylmuramoyl-L-alanine--D-glutamate ligase, partial [Candidatus Limiplasma sp.]|nr:UDP-N-acetylmuramoyl-L-alanine--D-glutamate ligase [Candidatus Limiplasma sp.]
SSVALVSKKSDVVVIEVSSFQLETIKTFHAGVAALLNITEDHLNRHGTMEQYIRLKQRLFENQTPDDVAVLNADDPVLLKMADKLKARVALFSRTRPVEQGAFIEDGKIIWRWDGVSKPICDADQILIPGPHNLENALAATAMAASHGVPAAVIRHTLQSFTGVEHLIEKVRVLHGITFINDSKGTNVDSTIKAVQSMKAPTVIILGGYDKHTDFLPLAKEIEQSGMIDHVVVIGETARQITETLQGIGYQAITHATSMEEAVETARGQAVSGGNVILSPACASFDMFTDYEQRGRIFKEIVHRLN